MGVHLQPDQFSAITGYVPVKNAALYYREIGRGRPIFILHGGPDFDHNYMLPDMDRLADSFRLIYYDQRGRGRSAGKVQPEDVTIASEIEDLETLRSHFQLETAAVLGHSWGGLLALEHAVRHPDRVSHLILLNTAPASRDDYLLFRQELPKKRTASEIEGLKTLTASARYQAGDLEADARYYRLHFRATVRRPELLEGIVSRLRLNFSSEGILKARAIEDRLMGETWLSSDYNLLPRLGRLDIPTLIIHGEDDFIPSACASHIAQAIAGARFVLLPETGHFSYLENPDGVQQAIADFLPSG